MIRFFLKDYFGSRFEVGWEVWARKWFKGEKKSLGLNMIYNINKFIILEINI